MATSRAPRNVAVPYDSKYGFPAQHRGKRHSIYCFLASLYIGSGEGEGGEKLAHSSAAESQSRSPVAPGILSIPPAADP